MDDALPLPELAPLKQCTMCRAWLPRTEFHRNRRRRDGLQSYCRACNIARNQRWYREHPEVRAARMDDYARRRRRERQQGILDYLLEHPCVDCGETDPVVLEFDHLRDKIANVTAMVALRRPWSVILAEISKCEVVCANCHRRRTCARAGGFRYRMTRPGDQDRSAGTLGPEGA
jgi:hypothetical protein